MRHPMADHPISNQPNRWQHKQVLLWLDKHFTKRGTRIEIYIINYRHQFYYYVSCIIWWQGSKLIWSVLVLYLCNVIKQIAKCYHIWLCQQNQNYWCYLTTKGNKQLQAALFEDVAISIVGISANQNSFKMEVHRQYMKPCILNIG